jgi:FkbM family methyltransferase
VTLGSAAEATGKRVADRVLCGPGRLVVRYIPGTWRRRLVQSVNAALKQRAKVFRVQVPGVGYIEGRTDDLIHRYLYLFGVWEPHVTEWLRNRLRPGDVFVDVGSHTGYYSLLASRLVGPEGRVVAIEASPRTFEVLRRNLDGNGVSNARAVNLAATDVAAMVPVHEASDRNTGKTTIVSDGRSTPHAMVQGLPLAEILEEHELSMARVIKIDVEGAEAMVVRGLLPVVEQLRPDAELAVEVHSKRLGSQGVTVDAIVEPLREAGFAPFVIPNSYRAIDYLAETEWPEPWDGPLRGEAQLIFSRT